MTIKANRTDGSERGGMTRRRALGLAGVAGAAYVAGPLRPFGAGGDAAEPPEAEAASSCVLAPEVTEGPYWVDVPTAPATPARSSTEW